MIPLIRRILPDPFILALILTVAFASLAPAKGGFAVAVEHLATAAIVLLFFLHGAKLPRSVLDCLHLDRRRDPRFPSSGARDIPSRAAG